MKVSRKLQDQEDQQIRLVVDPGVYSRVYSQVDHQVQSRVWKFGDRILDQIRAEVDIW